MAKGLGRGLSSLIPNINRSIYAESRTTIVEIPVDKILPNRYQPRQEFPENKLQELANSIKQHGVAQPIVVAPGAIAGEYELIAGERRWRAAQIAGLKTIPAIVRTVKENERFEISLIENIQRDDLNPLEVATAISRLISEFDLTQEEIAQRLGKSRSAVANLLRLLTLPEEVQEMLRRGVITEGHARALAGVEDAGRQRSLARKIVSQHLTVREVEQIIQQTKKTTRQLSKKSRLDPELIRAAEQIQQRLGTKVKISGRPHSGRIEIYYYTLTELERLIKILSHKIVLMGLVFILKNFLFAGPVYVAKLPDLNSYTLFANGGWDGNWYIGYNNCWIEKLPPPPPGKYIRAYVGVKIGRAKTRNVSGKPIWEKEPIPGSVYVAISATPSWRGQDSFFLTDSSEIPLEGDPENALNGVGESRWFWTEIPLEKVNFSGPNFIAVWSPTPYFVSRDSAPILAGGWGDKEVNTWLDNTIAGYPPLSADLKTPVTIFEPAIALKLIPEGAPVISDSSLIQITEVKTVQTPSKNQVVVVAEVNVPQVEKSYPEISVDGVIWQKVQPVVYSVPFTYTLADELLGENVNYLRITVIDVWGNKISSLPLKIKSNQ